ncbi:pseudouridine synthase [Galbibacter pacificus]|uniref:Pseudouridine synthase n=1 Tax=Galbibacter pacificus TaxID=2996052 RepID=A0ABT6FQH9_9FLAO|nr:pseudouridine synthase [Galbibacter pacificus]MDG3581999.1 pseudouridine synthase [Galbibacter pacificus]MDG3585527.1 pseudouridine synthase [Galbibacter pacificus]
MAKSHTHFKLYKPYGYISQMYSNDERQARKKRFLKDLYNFPDGIMPIGRLDEKSEGLLLMTTDGKLSNTVNQSGIEKEYYTLVDGAITNEAIETLCNGVKIGVKGEKYLTKPCKAKQIDTPSLPTRKKKIRDERHGPTTWISITITEGKFRQVRKMTSAVGFPTLRLVRVRIGDIYLENLQPGDVETLSSIASAVI